MSIRGVTNSIINLSLILLFFSGLFIHSETRSLSGQYLSSQISTNNGLPQNTVYSITSDQKGFIWIGTDRGLSRFDGRNFRYFNMYNTPAIKNNSITSLLVRTDGVLMIGSYGGGIITYKDGKFKELDLGPGSSTLEIWQMVQDSGNNLWILTAGTELILVNTDEDIQRYSIEKQYGKLASIIELLSGEILLATEKSIFRIKNKKVTPYNIKNLIGPSIILSINSYTAEELLICTNSGLLKCRVNSNKIELISEIYKNNVVRSTYRDKAGKTWVITDRGLKAFEGSKEIHYIAEDRFFKSPLLTMVEGPEGNLWIGSSGRGLRILRKRGFFPHRISSEVLNAQAHSTCELNGFLVVGTQNRGLLFAGAEKYFSISTEEGLSSKAVNSVLYNNNRLLAGTKNGLNIINNPAVANQNPEIVNIIPGIEILSLYTTSDNTVLIGTLSHGLYKLEKSRAVKYKNGLNDSSFSIFTISENQNKSLLLGTDRGIKTFNRDAKTISTLPGTERITGTVYDVFKDLDQSIWIGTKDQGLLILRNNRLIHTGKINQLLLTPVFRILEDRNKKIWMSTNNGILMLGKDEVYKFIRNITDTLDPVLYSQNDGITIPVFSGGNQPAGSISPNGTIYFPTREGVIRFNSVHFPLNTQPPNVNIHHLLTDSDKFPVDKPIVLSHNVKTLSITYSIISFTNREKVISKIELTGNKKKWPPHSLTGEEIIFQDLLPGKYRLSITAANNDMVWNHKGASLTFRIRNPFHKTLPFYLLLIAFLYLLSPFIYRGFLNARKRKQLETKGKYKDSNLTTVDSHIYIRQLKQLLENDKLYLDPNLKIRDISSRMGIPRKVLSQLINDVLDENFKNFINRYRIEEAKTLLSDPDNRDFVLLKIIYEAGFNSKSVFNTAFKKHTGMTPSEFRKKNFST